MQTTDWQALARHVKSLIACQKCGNHPLPAARSGSNEYHQGPEITGFISLKPPYFSHESRQITAGEMQDKARAPSSALRPSQASAAELVAGGREIAIPAKQPLGELTQAPVGEYALSASPAQIDSEESSLLEWAAKNHRIFPSEEIASFEQQAGPQGGGSEHDAWVVMGKDGKVVMPEGRFPDADVQKSENVLPGTFPQPLDPAIGAGHCPASSRGRIVSTMKVGSVCAGSASSVVRMNFTRSSYTIGTTLQPESGAS